VPAPPAQTTDTPAAAAAPAPTPPPADDLESECNGLQVDRKWRELDQCADKLAATATATATERAAALKKRATEERKALARIPIFEAALTEQSLRRARAELEQIWPSSVELPKLKLKYEEAEKLAANELAQRLERAVTPDCAGYNAILAQERGTQVAHVIDLAARRAPCTAISHSQCDAAALAGEAEQLHKAGKLTASITKYDESWYCKHDPKIAKAGFIVACTMPSAQRAKLFWKRLPADVKPSVIKHCASNDIPQQQLDTP
jgi:hypothetical protein